MEGSVTTLGGRVPGWALRSDGYGSGDGDGYGSGSVAGYGYGAVAGYGYGDGSGDGYGSVAGYGYGDGSGDGYGSGSGDGYGSGSVAGYGYGYGYGDGSGDGYGDGDLERCRPRPVTVTAEQLEGACGGQVRAFERAFPQGGAWPDDIPRAVAAGLDIAWAQSKLGLLPPITEDVPEAA